MLGSDPGDSGGPVSGSEKAALKKELIELLAVTSQLQQRIAALSQRLDGGMPQIMPPPSRPASPEHGELIPEPELIPSPAPPASTPPTQGETAAGGTPPAAPKKLSELLYPVSKFKISYAYPNPKLPPIEQLEELKVLLGPQEDGFGPPRTGVAKKRNLSSQLYKLEGEKVYTGEGLQIVYTALAQEMNRRGLYGVLVLPDPADIDATNGEDLRAGRKPLKVVIYTSTVKQVRTISKQVKPGENAVDTEPLKWIAKDSPLQPGELLSKPALNDYLIGLNRATGRRVDAAINSSGEPGGIVLDYIVRQEKTFSAYSQLSNTGTESTGDLRFRVGMEYRDFVGHGDVLNADAISSTDGKSISVLGSYTYTLWQPAKLKLKIYGSYGKFTASDVGFDLQNFDGETVTAGSAFIWNPLNIKGAPLDFFAGAEYRKVSVNNYTFPQSGESQFFVPYVGMSIAQSNDRSSFAATAQVEHNFPSVFGTHQEDIDKLGRFNTDNEFTVGKWGLSASTYLEPIVFGAKWKEGTTWWKSTLAHEVAFSTHGQYTFGEARLIPQFEDVVGGYTSVRGYPEALTAGDTTVVGSAEYRLHLPKLLKPLDQILKDRATKKGEPPPADIAAPKFALRPNTVGSAFGRADWDLILRGFVDGGLTFNNNRIPSAEANETLLGAGVGVELQVMRYLDIRVDYGIALKDETDFLVHPVRAGDSRFHFLISLYW